MSDGFCSMDQFIHIVSYITYLCYVYHIFKWKFTSSSSSSLFTIKSSLIQHIHTIIIQTASVRSAIQSNSSVFFTAAAFSRINWVTLLYIIYAQQPGKVLFNHRSNNDGGENMVAREILSTKMTYDRWSLWWSWWTHTYTHI